MCWARSWRQCRVGYTVRKTLTLVDFLSPSCEISIKHNCSPAVLLIPHAQERTDTFSSWTSAFKTLHFLFTDEDVVSIWLNRNLSLQSCNMGDNYTAEGQHLIRASPLFHCCIPGVLLSGCEDLFTCLSSSSPLYCELMEILLTCSLCGTSYTLTKYALSLWTAACVNY